MTTTEALPELTEHDHPEHCWTWTKTEVAFINAKVRDYAARVSAAKDAEIEKLRSLVREYLQTAQELVDENISIRAAAQQALEALQDSIQVPSYGGHPKQEAAADALTAALESKT